MKEQTTKHALADRTPSHVLTHHRNESITTTSPEYESPVPFYGTILIAVAGCLFLVCCIFCCCAFCSLRRSRKKKEKRGTAAGAQRLEATLRGISPTLRAEKIQPDMQELMNDEDEEDTESLGRLNFAIDYNSQKGELSVTVIQAQNLPAMDLDGTSDPYVKIYLLPAKKPTFVTKVQWKTCNPIFQEAFMFQVDYSEILGRTLAFHIYDHDKFGMDDVIGHVFVPLNELDVNQVHLDWKDVQKTTRPPDQTTAGEVCVSLRYVPTNGHLEVIVIEAKNLPVLDSGKLPDVFVRLTLMLKDKKLKNKKSTVRKRTINPYFNEIFEFDVPSKHIRTVTLKLTLSTPGFFGSKSLGYVEFGSLVQGGSQYHHWSDMLANPRRPIACWHPLDSDNHR